MCVHTCLQSERVRHAFNYVWYADRFNTDEKLLYHQSTHTSEMDENEQSTLFKCPEDACQETPYKTANWADFKQHAWKIHQVYCFTPSFKICLELHVHNLNNDFHYQNATSR